MSRIGWGVDKQGVKAYLCSYCFLIFGEVDPDTIVHECDTSEPMYKNRDKFHKDHPLFKAAK